MIIADRNWGSQIFSFVLGVRKLIHVKTRPTPISRVRDLYNDLESLAMIKYTFKRLKMTKGNKIDNKR